MKLSKKNDQWKKAWCRDFQKDMANHVTI
jgi:hypothetical protein